MNVLAENVLTAMLSILICGVLDIPDAISAVIVLICVCLACVGFLVARDYHKGGSLGLEGAGGRRQPSQYLVHLKMCYTKCCARSIKQVRVS